MGDEEWKGGVAAAGCRRDAGAGGAWASLPWAVSSSPSAAHLSSCSVLTAAQFCASVVNICPPPAMST